MSRRDISIYPVPSPPITRTLHFFSIITIIKATIGFRSRHHFETASAPVIIAIATRVVPPSQRARPPINIGTRFTRSDERHVRQCCHKITDHSKYSKNNIGIHYLFLPASYKIFSKNRSIFSIYSSASTINPTCPPGTSRICASRSLKRFTRRC